MSLSRGHTKSVRIGVCGCNSRTELPVNTQTGATPGRGVQEAARSLTIKVELVFQTTSNHSMSIRYQPKNYPSRCLLPLPVRALANEGV